MSIQSTVVLNLNISIPLATLTEDDVKEFVASQVSDYKRLAEVEFVKTIPKLTSGKIQRRLLREKHEKDSQNK